MVPNYRKVDKQQTLESRIQSFIYGGVMETIPDIDVEAFFEVVSVLPQGEGKLSKYHALSRRSQADRLESLDS